MQLHQSGKILVNYLECLLSKIFFVHESRVSLRYLKLLAVCWQSVDSVASSPDSPTICFGYYIICSMSVYKYCWLHPVF